MPEKVRKRKLRGVYIDGEGNKYEGEIIEVCLKSGESLENLLERALSAEDDDNIIKEKSKEIKEFLNRTSNEKDTLKRWFELGKILQFVEKLKLKSETDKKEAYTRLFKDLKVNIARNPSLKKLERYPIHMYTLSKLPKELVFYKGMTWSRWFDVLEYKMIIKNSQILTEIIQQCCRENWTAKELRKKLQLLNKRLKDE